MRQIIVTEGKYDKKLLEKVLPDYITSKTIIDNGAGFSSALSLASSYYIRGDNKILVIIDSDTNDKEKLREKKDSSEKFLDRFSDSSKIKLVLSVPELEVLFFTDKGFIEKYFNAHLSDTEYELYKRDPKYAFEKLSNGKRFIDVRNELLENIDTELKNKMINEKPIQEIIEYFQ